MLDDEMPWPAIIGSAIGRQPPWKRATAQDTNDIETTRKICMNAMMQLIFSGRRSESAAACCQAPAVTKEKVKHVNDFELLRTLLAIRSG